MEKTAIKKLLSMLLFACFLLTVTACSGGGTTEKPESEPGKSAGTEGTIGELCPDADIGEGLAIRGSTAQNDPDSAKEDVTKWLSGNGYIQ